jgi:diguanylate cyclase (GGDEF)-like protein
MKILIVEDVKAKASAIVEAVGAAGIKDGDIHVAPDLRNAKTVMRSEGPFSLLILDMRIPQRFDGTPTARNGIDLLQWVERKKVEIGGVIAVSAYELSEEDARELAIYGVAFVSYRQSDRTWRDFLTAFVRRRAQFDSSKGPQDVPGDNKKYGLPDQSDFTCDLERLAEIDGGQTLTHAFVDLDNLKALNDLLTHDKADLVIAEVVVILRHTLGTRARLYHRSGDEFLVLLENHTAEEARPLMQRCCLAVAHHSFANQDCGKVTVSIGIASLPEHVQTVEELRETAIRANQAAKRAGKNRVCVAGEPENIT